MLATFVKHGSNAVLGIPLIALGWALGLAALSPLLVLLGAGLFHPSKYDWHRFVFYAALAC